MSDETPYEVVMPKLGLIMTEARLAKWYIEDGEWVEDGELLFALESDKSAIDIEAPAGGRVSIVVLAGDTVPVMTPVAYILVEESAMPGTISKPVHAAAEETTVKEGSKQKPPSQARPISIVRASPKARKQAQLRGIDLADIVGSGPREMVVVADLNHIVKQDPVNATPIARKMAAEYRLDLRDLTGTGPGGRINRTDVTNALAGAMANLPTNGPASAPGTAEGAPDVSAPDVSAPDVSALDVSAPDVGAPDVGAPDVGASDIGAPSIGEKPRPLTGLRGVIAQRLSESWRERPQVTLTTEVEATNLVSARRQLNAETGRKVSYNAFFLMAAARVLREQPQVNVRLTDVGVVTLQNINIGLAVDTKRGLLVPVLFRADKNSILALDTKINDMVQRALAGRILPDELSGGTFTITNLGLFGIDAFTPIINPPEAAVLGIGRIAPRPFVVGRQLEVRDTVTLSLSFDHRLLDGAPAARFLQRIATLIERPIALTSTDNGT